MSETRTVVVAGASTEESAHIEQCLSDWECVNAPLSNEGTAISSIPRTPTLVIVYAQEREKNTLAICEQLRNAPESSAAPILLVISRYEITQGNAVKSMGNATFIMTPFDEKELQRKTAELVKDT